MKISRPMIYALVLGAVGYAVVLLTEPEQTARKATPKKTAGAAKAPEGFTREDMEARFDRAAAPRRNAFKPGIVAQKAAGPGAGGVGALLSGPLSGWTLTGITVVQGVRNALLENAGTQESVFLKTGDTWHGLRVGAIEPASVVFVHSDGTTTRYGFPEPAEETAAPSAAGPTPVAPVVVAVPPASGAPTVPAGALDGTDGNRRRRNR